MELDVEVYTDLLPGMERINTQIMAGEGPDLLLMSSAYGTTDVYKMMKAQAFAPLDEFMGQDEGWDAEDYAGVVMDAGIYEGRQMVMPLSYLVQAAVTSEENLEKAGIAWDSCNDMGAFLQETAIYYESGSAEQVLGVAGQLTGYPAFMSDRFLDYSRGTLGVDRVGSCLLRYIIWRRNGDFYAWGGMDAGKCASGLNFMKLGKQSWQRQGWKQTFRNIVKCCLDLHNCLRGKSEVKEKLARAFIRRSGKIAKLFVNVDGDFFLCELFGGRNLYEEKGIHSNDYFLPALSRRRMGAAWQLWHTKAG